MNWDRYWAGYERLRDRALMIDATPTPVEFLPSFSGGVLQSAVPVITSLPERATTDVVVAR